MSLDSTIVFSPEKLRVLREKRGMARSQVVASLCEVFGISVDTRTFRNWEVGKAVPKATVVAALAQLFEVDLGRFYQTVQNQ